jgi:putative transcriptional regulator
LTIMLAKFRSRFKRPIRFTTTLREIREAHGLSQSDLARDCEVSVQTIRLIEEMKYEPSVVLAERLAMKLGYTVETLFTVSLQPDTLHTPRDERADFAMYRYGYRLMIFLIFGSLIAANLSFAFNWGEDVGIAFGAVWGIGAVLFIATTIAIPGYWSYNQAANRKTTPPKVRILGSVIMGLGFAILMMFSVDTDKPMTARILRFVPDAIVFGGASYFVRFFQGRAKS